VNRIRCAIYTRKSSEEGLEQEFNSLDAQREACEAYVRSQRHEGWIALPDRFDDGGYSGGNMERPALQRLLAEINSGKVDVIVVYKVDRLTRSLSDFARIVDAFDARKVSFVSVTQQFNTTSSMGRLTLNMLLSFAQFEREVTGERIRDKIAASKRKGMWMGGTTPLGYMAKDRTLEIHPGDAEKVRTLFRLYLEIGNVDELTAEARCRNITSRNGKMLHRGALYHLLKNPVYIGQISHKGTCHPGLHPAIIDGATWDAVQAKLESNRVERRDGVRAREPSLLAGKLFDDRGVAFTPSHALRSGKRYRYYVERGPIGGVRSGRRPRLRRIPAQEIESLVGEAVANLLRSSRRLIEATGLQNASSSRTRSLVEAGIALAERFEADRSECHRKLRSMIDRVVVAEESVRIEIGRAALVGAFGGAEQRILAAESNHTIVVPAKLKARGVELRFILYADDGSRRPAPDLSLIRAVVRGHDWFRRMMAPDRPTMADLAAADGVTPAYLRRLFDLAFLAPDIVAAILDGRQPIELSAERLTRLDDLPLDWGSQRRQLGFG
jgi:DNA invertase Pin-like site-specific DNA recombinase